MSTDIYYPYNCCRCLYPLENAGTECPCGHTCCHTCEGIAMLDKPQCPECKAQWPEEFEATEDEPTEQQIAMARLVLSERFGITSPADSHLRQWALDPNLELSHDGALSLRRERLAKTPEQARAEREWRETEMRALIEASSERVDALLEKI